MKYGSVSRGKVQKPLMESKTRQNTFYLQETAFYRLPFSKNEMDFFLAIFGVI